MKGPYEGQPYHYKFGDQYLEFDSIGFALLAESQNYEVLTTLLKEESAFIPSPKDFTSFIKACINLKWQRGLDLFLQTFGMQFIFASLPNATQKELVHTLLKNGMGGKQLVKKPYIR